MSKPKGSIYSILGKIATRYRWLMVGLWMVVTIVALPFAPQAGDILHSGGYTSPDAQSEHATDVLAQKLKTPKTTVQVIFTSKRYSVDDLQFAKQMQQALTKLKGWSEVTHVVTFIDNPRQVSRDHHAAYANIEFKSDSDTVTKLLPELRRRLKKEPDLQSSVGGDAIFYDDIITVSESDLRRAETLTFPFAIIALIFVFRSLVAAFLPALIGGCAVLTSLALIFALGHFTTLSIFVLNITSLFGISLGVDYSLFMVSRFREELACGRNVTDAVVITVATAGRAVTFSGLTVSIGLAGLTCMRIEMLRSIGIAGILVVLLAILAAVTLLPAVLAIMGHKINALPVRLPHLWKRTGLQTTQNQIATDQDGFWYRLSHMVMRYPWRVAVPVLCLLIGLGSPFLWIRLSAPDASILPTDVPSRQAYDSLAQRFDQSETTPILLAVQTKGDVLTKANIDNLYYYVKRIKADLRVKRVDSIVSADPRFTLAQYEQLYAHPQLITDLYLKDLLHSTVTGNTMMIQVISKYKMVDVQSKALVLTIRNTNPGHDITVLVGGRTASNLDYADALYTDFPRAVLIIAIISYIVLFLLFRSAILPLKAIIMNTLSILASYGALVVVFQQGFLHQFLGFEPWGFVEATCPVLLFCCLFGLSMDYEVFMLSRIQETYWETGDNTQAVAVGLQRCGGLITSAAAIIMVVGACFTTVDIIVVKTLGLGIALAVLIDATLVRGLLVPASRCLLGDLIWWPGGTSGASSSLHGESWLPELEKESASSEEENDTYEAQRQGSQIWREKSASSEEENVTVDQLLNKLQIAMERDIKAKEDKERQKEQQQLQQERDLFQIQLRDTREERDHAREQLRDALQERDHTRGQLRDAQEERDHARGQLRDTQQERDQAQEERNRFQRQLRDAQEERDQARRQLRDAQEEHNRTQEQFGQAQQERDQVREQLMKIQQEQSPTQEQLRQAQQNLNRTQERLSKAQQERDQAQQNLNRTWEQLLNTQQERDQAQQELAQTQEQLRQTQLVHERGQSSREEVHTI